MKTLKRICLRCCQAVLLLSGLTSIAYAGRLVPSVDVAQFQDRSNKSYIEIYYSLSEDAVTYRPDEKGQFGCQLVLDIEITHKQEVWANKIWQIRKTVADTTDIEPNSQLVDVLRYFIDDPGEYAIKMRIRDMYQPGLVDSVQNRFQVMVFDPQSVAISTVELATVIQRSGGDNHTKLTKNRYFISPNPSGLFGEGASSLYYYFEVYNLNEYAGGDRYTTVTLVQDAYGNTVEGLGLAYKSKKRSHDTSLEMGMLNISTLPSGKYQLIYGVADTAKNILVSHRKEFFVYNPDVARTQLVAQGNYGPLTHMPEKQLDEEFRYARYILSKEELDLYKSMENADAKRKYLYEMWSKQRPQYPVSGMPFRDEYLARVKYADKNFTSVFDPGWRSDRGRVFILYGAPSSIERFPSTQEYLPYQIWTYEFLRGQSGVQFVFADRTGLSKYELIHSDLRGEIQDYSWKKSIARGSNEKIFR